MLLTWLQQTPGWVLPGASLDMNFAGGTYYPAGGVGGLITTTRAQTVSSYALTSTGTLTAFAANTARITDLGLLVEEARTNYLLQSQTFDNATWVKTNATVTADATTAPDGTTTADKLIASVGSNQHYVAQAVSGLTAAEGRVETVYAKYAGVQYLAMYMSQGPIQAWFDLQGGTVSNITGSAAITALGNGWYRCQLYSSAATGTGDTFELHTATIAGNYTHTGDGVNGIYLWGAQLERPATFASSYIPTTTVSVARNADVVTLNSVAPFANGFGAFIDVRAIPSFAATVYYLAAAAGNRIFYSSSNANLSTYNGTTVLSADPLSGNLSSGFRGAARYKTSDRAIAVNSGTVATDANTNGVPGTVYIGSLNGTGPQNTYTKRITIFQTLSNVQIGALAQ